MLLATMRFFFNSNFQIKFPVKGLRGPDWWEEGIGQCHSQATPEVALELKFQFRLKYLKFNTLVSVIWYIWHLRWGDCCSNPWRAWELKTVADNIHSNWGNKSIFWEGYRSRISTSTIYSYSSFLFLLLVFVYDISHHLTQLILCVYAYICIYMCIYSVLFNYVKINCKIS